MPTSLAVIGSRTRDTVDMVLCSWFPLYRNLTVGTVDLTGRNVIITGANVGIGLESARQLAAFGASVTLACRSVEKGEAARDALIASTGKSNIDFRVLDTSSFASVRAFVAEWGDKPLDILMCNAGVTPTRYYKTADSIEESFQIIFLSHHLLTLLLLPIIRTNGRIINVSSLASYSGALDPRDVGRTDYLERTLGVTQDEFLKLEVFIGLYADAKLAQIASAREMQKRLDANAEYREKRIVVSSCHPGIVKTSIWERHLGETPNGDLSIARLMTAVNMFGITTEQGAITQIWLASAPECAVGGGQYWTRCKVSAPSALVENESLRSEMWGAWAAKCGIPETI